MEIFAIRFIRRFPEIALADNSPFYGACLDQKLNKPPL